ncbi:hypothetical protein PR202_gb14990 [Eleusine coracana subsp. coracana]|uniref:Auxin response factor n=1 Tax=Eleusine coracana subsp. coracana TaxID=191504 RepID=A0AAV5EUE2_ELECO|nr:hypothetical protein QOZ80_4BG0341550 [Eleusine coracana subsp. coracana]GJN27014.1 hypothetical protein PR202_gb14990 [Eleusine coracana subsp. coracana]
MPAAVVCAAPPGGMLAFAQEVDKEAAAVGRQVDKQLWLACAGSMCTVPPVGAAVYYFPQGHAEQASAAVVDLSTATRVPPLVPCRVVAVRYLADPGTDEVFAKMLLVPLRPGEPVADVGEAASAKAAATDQDDDQHQPKPASFAKTLTQSDANNGGGFSVPRFCAETIFPELDYRAEPPVQSVVARDVHGADWKFRHIYRGTPRRHLLTTGWSHFVNQKKLLAGDSIVFLRGEDGQVHVGLRRAKRGGGAGDEAGWGDPYSKALLVRGCGNASSSSSSFSKGKVPAEDVVAAARLAAAGQPFEVTHYPRASSPEFCVRAKTVMEAMQVQWCPGIRFKMPFETEDSSRISWFMGTVAAVQPADPARWPQSPWRLLQVGWDEPELLQNVKRVCPWQVELVSSMPNLHLPSSMSSPPRKKPRILPPCFPFDHLPPLDPYHHHAGFLLPFPESSSAAAGIQGARQARFASSFSEPHIGNLHTGLLLSGVNKGQHHAAPRTTISTDLTIGNNTSPARQSSCSPSSKRKVDDVMNKPQGIVLFGRTILTEDQIKGRTSTKANSGAEKAPTNTAGSEGSGSGVIQGSPTSSWRLHQWPIQDQSSSELLFGLEPGQCKVFVESDAVGRNLDLSALGSFDELHARLSGMFAIDGDELRGHVLYRTASGDVKHVGDGPFGAFVKSARRITILTDAGSDNIGGGS